MTNRMKIMFLVLCIWTLIASPARAADSPSSKSVWFGPAEEALTSAMSGLKAAKGDSKLLVLTNAGFAQVAGASTEAFFDLAQKVTGCSFGQKSLLQVHKSIDDPMWFSIYKKDAGRIAYYAWTGQKFENQDVNAATETIFTPDGWKDAASGLMGANTFSVVSLSLTWAAGPPWPLLLAATFHDHFCPGVNAGYFFAEYARKHYPLGPGDKYVFVTAPANCPADALQMMFNTTAGKSSGYVKSIDPKTLGKYAKGKVTPSTVVMRVNAKADSCDGVVLGMDWTKAYEDTGVKAEEIAAPGGPGNPVFWIARAKMSRELAKLPQDKLLGYVAELKKFSGKAALADELSSGDPYAPVFEK